MYSGSCSVREPREGCGVLRVPTGTRYLLAQRPTLHRTTGRRLAATGHGPCHRPACPPWSFERREASFVMTRDSVSRTTERAGRPMARPVSVHAQTVDGRPMRFRALCKEIPRPCRDAESATPLAGLTYRARTGVHPPGGSLPPSDGPDPRTILPGAMAGPTPNAGNPTTSVVGGCQFRACARRN